MWRKNIFKSFTISHVILLFLLFKLNYHTVKSWTLPESSVSVLASTLHEQIQLNFSVFEGVSVGTLIGVIKPSNLSVNTQPPYLIVPVPGGDPKVNTSNDQINNTGGGGVDTDLNIDQSTGEIRTAVQLDRELRSYYSFIAISLTGANIKVTITIEDINDNPPIFPVSAVDLEFPENSKEKDAKRTLPPARDMDLGRFATQKYHIISGNVGNAFKLLSHREKDEVLYLDLQVNGILDRETVPNYTLVIEAYDGGHPPLKGEMTVRVIILDHNDCEPVFSQSHYYGRIPENATLGTSVLRVTATDSDRGDNGLITYSLHRKNAAPTLSSSSTYFGINKNTGWIFVTKSLDFESIPVHELLVVATDSGAQPLETSALVSIKIIDVNDNQPTIGILFLTESAKPKVPENAKIGDLVARISVNDADSGDSLIVHKSDTSNGLFVTLLGGDGTFSLKTQDSIVHLIVVTGHLNRQIKSKYSLTVMVTDQGNPPLNSTNTFELEIIEVNNNPSYSEPETHHVTPTAVIPPAADIGYLNLSNETTEVYSFEVKETAMIGEKIGYLIIKKNPKDERNCLNGFYIYDNAYFTNHMPFIIDSHNRPNINFILSNQLDYESTNKYSVSLCVDWDQCAITLLDDTHTRRNKHCKKQIRINIKVLNDDSDCDPFPKQIKDDVFDMKIPINDMAQYSRISHVFYFNATNCDTNKITYDIMSPSISSDSLKRVFNINDNALQFRPFDNDLLEKIRREKTMLILYAKKNDQIFRSMIANVRILNMEKGLDNVAFINDNYLEIPEDCCKIRDNVLQMRVNISHEDFIIKYYLNMNNDYQFDINSDTGLLILNKEFDWKQKPEHKVNVTASIHDIRGYALRNVSTIITIRLINGNDEPLSYLQKSYEKEVIENENTLLLKVEAKDVNSLRFANLTYVMPEGYEYSKLFTLNQRNGELRTMTPFDREKRSSYRIPIYAFDEHFRHSALTYVNIKVIDVNDNAPYFTNNNYEIKIPENIEPGVLFHTIVAVDNDLYGYGASKSGLHYRITSGNSAGKFIINPQNGELSTSGVLDKEKQNFYNLTIEVSDTLHFASCNLFIELIDVNDNAPIFDRQSYYAIIDNTPANTTVVTVRASDLDGDDIMYSINTSNPDSTYFHIDPKSGEITTYASSLSFINEHNLQSSNVFTFDVLAAEVGKAYAAHTSKATVHITLVNSLNNAVPRLKSYPYVVSVDGFKEDFRVGTEIGRIELANAMGAQQSDNFIFRVISNGDSGNYPSFMDYFNIHSQSGKIVVKRPLNSNYYEAIIEVTRGVDTTLVTRSLIQIFIGNIDDSKKLVPQSFKVELHENVPIGTEVINIGFRSRLNYQKLTYEFVYSSVNYNYFNFDPNSGLITLKQQLDYERDPSIIEMIVFTRKSHSSVNGHYFNITISLLNVEDNPPRFTQRHYISTIKEGEIKGTFVAQISAVDIDNIKHVSRDGHRHSLTYHILEGNHDNAFIIDPPGSGIVRTNIVLDREIRDHYLIKIVASDAEHIDGFGSSGPLANFQLSSHCTLEINVIDVNDNVPVFPPYQEISINEDVEIGSVISTLTANDVDTYPMLTYYKQKGNKFHDADDLFDIGLYTGKITVKAPLVSYDTNNDEKIPNQYQLNILSSDSIHTVETQVLINVKRKEIQENPIFTNRSNFYAEINPEKNDCPMTSINCEIIRLQIVKRDNKNQPKNKVNFSFAHNYDNGLYIDQYTGIIYNNKTLRSNVPKVFNLIVYANYIGIKTKSKAAVIIKVSSSEKQSNGKEKMLFIETDAEKIGTAIYKLPKLNGMEWDNSLYGANANRYFTIMRGNQLTLIKNPNKFEYNFTIISKSKDQSDSVLVNVKIKNRDAESYERAFKSSIFDIDLSENEAIGSEVYSLRPLSIRNAINYHIISGNELNHFRIDENGIIYVNANLNYENINHYQLGVSAEISIQKGKSLNTFAVVNINIINVNAHQNCPKFLIKHYKTIVDENIEIGSKILKVQLHNPNNNTLNYSLIRPKDVPSPFDYKNEHLITTGIIDYESIDFVPPIYKIILRAKETNKHDNSICGTIETMIEIQIGSIDEYPPRFTSESYKFRLTTKSGIPQFKVGQVLASDADSGPDGIVMYTLRSSSPSNTLDYFSVNSKSGEISINTVDIDSERLLSLIISASSGRSDSLSALTVVEVILTIDNDNSEIGNIIKSDDRNAQTISTAPTSLPGWVLFLVVLLMLITVVLLVSIVVIRLHQQQQQQLVGHTRHMNNNNIGSILRKIGTVGSSDANINPFHQTHHNGGGFIVPGTAPPPCYNDVTLSSPVGIGVEGHSASSGRGSAEDEDEVEADLDDVDEEVRMINEGGDYYGEVNHDDMPDEVTTTAEYLARLGVINHREEPNIRMDDDDDDDDEDDEDVDIDELRNINSRRTANLFNSIRSNRESHYDRNQSDANEWPSMCGSVSTIVQSQEDLSGSYNWDYLQDWGPKYQPIASVFAEIARLKAANGERDGEDLTAIQAQLAAENGSTISTSTASSSAHHNHHHGHHRYRTMSSPSSTIATPITSCFQPVAPQSSVPKSLRGSDVNSSVTIRAYDEMRI